MPQCLCLWTVGRCALRSSETLHKVAARSGKLIAIEETLCSLPIKHITSSPQDSELIFAPFLNDQRKSSRNSRRQDIELGKAVLVASLIRPALAPRSFRLPTTGLSFNYRSTTQSPRCAFQLARKPDSMDGQPDSVGRANIIGYSSHLCTRISKSRSLRI